MFKVFLTIICIHISLFSSYSDAYLTIHAHPQTSFGDNTQRSLRIQKPYDTYHIRHQRHSCQHKKQSEKNENQARILAYNHELGLLEHELIATPVKEQYHQDRLRAIKVVLRNKSTSHKPKKISSQELQFLHHYGIDKKHIPHKKMNTYELQLHKEFCTQLTHAAQFIHISDKVPEYRAFIDAIGYGISCGIQANNDHQAQQATVWADFGWKALSIASAMTQGIFLGTKNAVTSAVNVFWHPIETVQSLAHGVSMLGVLIGKTYAYMIRHELALERDDESDIQLQLQQAITIANAVIDHSSHMSMQDKLKNGIAIATEFIVAPYIFKAMHALCGKIRPVAAGIMHALQDEQNIERFNNSDFVKATDKIKQGILTVDSDIDKSARAIKKVSNMEQFLYDFNFGKILKKSSIKLKTKWQGASIYKITEKTKKIII